jgi:hypothetical protein
MSILYKLRERNALPYIEACSNLEIGDCACRGAHCAPAV